VKALQTAFLWKKQMNQWKQHHHKHWMGFECLKIAQVMEIGALSVV